MASFNLGRIKGEKGDTGAKGDCGEKGEKGDTGERGERGSDAPIPVFSVGITETVDAGREAEVSIISEDPANPVINFSIPRGADGKDAGGDMTVSIYDPTGRAQDIYEYVDRNLQSCVSKTGDILTGVLQAGECELAKRCVRNIFCAHSLPENGANGDICIVTEDINAKRLSDCAPGDIMLLEEAGSDVAYLIVAKNYHGENTVTLVRKDLMQQQEYFDISGRTRYIMSNIDVFLESVHVKNYSKKLQQKLILTSLDNTCHRHCFLLSQDEYKSMDYFSAPENRIACKNNSTTAQAYLTRSLTTGKTVYQVADAGGFSSCSQSSLAYVRPAIVLSGNTVVENVEYKSGFAVALSKNKSGIYILSDGVWKECGE